MKKRLHVTFLPKKAQLLFITGSLLLALFLAWYISGQNASHAQAAICSEISYKTVRITAKDTLWSIAKDNNVTLRTGAYLIAVKRVVEAQNGRGLYV